MSDLITFLRARYDEKEEFVRMARQQHHLANLHAERIRREIRANRLMLDWLDHLDRFMDRDDMSWHRLSGEVDTDHARCLLALPYADHRDYREEWRLGINPEVSDD